MIDNFNMTISRADFLRIMNHGIRDLTWGDLVKRDHDTIVDVLYSRANKQYTLVFESGKKLKVVADKAA